MQIIFQLAICNILVLKAAICSSYVQCDYIVKGKYQIAPSKAVVGIDHYAYTKAILGKSCPSSHSCNFVKKHSFNQTVMPKYQITPSKAVVGVDRPVYALS